MTRAEYTAFQAAFAAFMEREGLTNLSTVSEEEGLCEPYFSWRPCECCGSHLGGDRYDCDGFSTKSGQAEGPFSVCQDCMYYAEYGQLDDTTMDETEGGVA
jgi:hypothetical protein